MLQPYRYLRDDDDDGNSGERVILSKLKKRGRKLASSFILSCTNTMQKSGYGRDGIYRSLRPSLVLPKDDNLSLVSFLFRSVSSFPTKPALIDADSSQTLSFAQLKSLVVKVSHGLLHLGNKKDDVVLLFAPNSILYPICFFGITAIGAVASTANPIYTVAELSKQVKDSNPKLVITVPELWDKVKGFNLPALILGSRNPSLIASNSKITTFDELLEYAGSSTELPASDVKQSDTAALLYSSGTTGVSKGVILSHKNFIASSLMVGGDDELAGEMHDVFLCVLPMFHVFGLAIVLYSQLRRGNALVCMKKFDFEMMLMAVEKYRVTRLWLVPPIILALAKQSVVKKYDLSSLDQIGSGAAPLGKDLMKECAKNFPQAVVIQVILMLDELHLSRKL